MSIGSCWFFGFFIMITLAACMNPDPTVVLESPFGQPMAQIYYEAIGKKGALGMMTLLFCVQWLMGLSIVRLPMKIQQRQSPMLTPLRSSPHPANPGPSPATAPSPSPPSSAPSPKNSASSPSAQSGAAPSWPSSSACSALSRRPPPPPSSRSPSPATISPGARPSSAASSGARRNSSPDRFIRGNSARRLRLSRWCFLRLALYCACSLSAARIRRRPI